ncbi:uncharacterized protein LOC126264197 [Aethina tumida]|nr:uncharacterized protein LOC126264196 [Aethina tumida]XP_049817012.1 uncharacterized protein LOC126264197 [Aethina tumida]
MNKVRIAHTPPSDRPYDFPGPTRMEFGLCYELLERGAPEFKQAGPDLTAQGVVPGLDEGVPSTLPKFPATVFLPDEGDNLARKTMLLADVRSSKSCTANRWFPLNNGIATSWFSSYEAPTGNNSR